MAAVVRTPSGRGPSKPAGGCHWGLSRNFDEPPSTPTSPPGRSASQNPEFQAADESSFVPIARNKQNRGLFQRQRRASPRAKSFDLWPKRKSDVTALQCRGSSRPHAVIENSEEDKLTGLAQLPKSSMFWQRLEFAKTPRLCIPDLERQTPRLGISDLGNRNRGRSMSRGSEPFGVSSRKLASAGAFAPLADQDRGAVRHAVTTPTLSPGVWTLS